MSNRSKAKGCHKTQGWHQHHGRACLRTSICTVHTGLSLTLDSSLGCCVVVGAICRLFILMHLDLLCNRCGCVYSGFPRVKLIIGVCDIGWDGRTLSISKARPLKYLLHSPCQSPHLLSVVNEASNSSAVTVVNVFLSSDSPMSHFWPCGPKRTRDLRGMVMDFVFYF
jgi:hypothetical protein